MKKYRNLIFYASVVGIFVVLIYIFVCMGSSDQVLLDTRDVATGKAHWFTFIRNMTHSMLDPLPVLLLQIVVILLAVRILGWICQRIGQPSVVGEITAGIMLGPSLLGTLFPEISDFLFPISSLGNIGMLSNIGLVLFMFIVGMELDLKTIKNKANKAIIISHVGIVIPFALGVILSYFLYGEFTYEHTAFLPFALFMGIAMSIAAFPVMARIIHERGINKTPLGPVIITCAAMDDITAWCLLAGVIAIVNAGSLSSSIFVIISAIIYIFIMFKFVRPFLKRIVDLRTSKRTLNKSIVAILFLVLFLSAYATEVIGIHALFGAFLAGVIMPTNMTFRGMFTSKIEDIALILLLPLFFVFTGLRTQIGLLNDPHLWMICGVIVLLAVTGKLFGSTLAAKFVGNNWKDSLTIGALMNTRGLMELVVLNIGLDLGILTPEVFAMMVVMALATTFMTSPTLNLIDRIFKKHKSNLSEQKKFKVLVSFKTTDMGRKLLAIASCFVNKRPALSQLTILHMSEGRPLYQNSLEDDEESIFKPLLDDAEALKQPVDSIFKISSNPHSDVSKIANKENYDFLIIGLRGSIFSDSMLGRILGFSNQLIHIPDNLLTRSNRHSKWLKTFTTPVLDESTRTIINKSDMPVGIFVDRGLVEIKNVFIPILNNDDVFVGFFMRRMFENSNIRITLWDAIGLEHTSIDFVNAVKEIRTANPYLFQMWNNNIPIDGDILKKQDLMMISLNSWKKLHDENPHWLKSIPSAFILTN